MPESVVKPWKTADDDTCVYYHYECPVCGNFLGYVPTGNTCNVCHSILDWSDEVKKGERT